MQAHHKFYITLYPFAIFSLVSFAGYITGFAGAAIVMVFALIHSISKNNFLNPFIYLLLTFFFADLISPASNFFDSLRFIVLAFGVYLSLKFSKVNDNLGWAILPFTLLALFFSLAYGPIPFDASIRAIAYLLLALVLFGYAKLLFKEYPLQFSFNLFTLFFLFYLIPLILYFTPLRDNFQVVGRYSGFMGNPNGLGLLSIMAIPLIDYLFLVVQTRTNSLNKKYLFLIKFIIIISVILTGSRNALFSIIIYELFKVGFKTILSSLTTILALAISYFAIFSIDWLGIINSLGLNEFFRIDTLESGSGRTEVWEVVWKEIKKSPFTGKGILYDVYFIDQHRRQMTGVIPRAWYGVWNSYLSLWMDVGLVGLLAYFFFVLRIYLLSEIKRLSTPFLIAALFSAIAESWMAASLNAFTPLFFLYFALQSVPLEEIQLKNYTRESSSSL